MEISGNVQSELGYLSAATGAFKVSNSKSDWQGTGHIKTYATFSFTASKNWTGSTSSNGAHKHTITSTTSTTTSIADNSSVNAIYGRFSNGVRPNALGIRVKTRAK